MRIIAIAAAMAAIVLMLGGLLWSFAVLVTRGDDSDEFATGLFVSMGGLILLVLSIWAG